MEPEFPQNESEQRKMSGPKKHRDLLKDRDKEAIEQDALRHLVGWREPLGFEQMCGGRADLQGCLCSVTLWLVDRLVSLPQTLVSLLLTCLKHLPHWLHFPEDTCLSTGLHGSHLGTGGRCAGQFGPM